MLRAKTFTLAFLALTSVAFHAVAQDATDLAARQELLAQARAADTAGHHDQALELASRAGRIAMSPSVRGFIAQQQVTVGQYAEALGNAHECQREASQNVTLQDRDAIISMCRSIVQQSEPHVGHLIVRIGTVSEGLHVTIAGHVLLPALYGVSSIVNPGDVVVEATAHGYQPFRTTITIGSGATGNIEVQMIADPNATTAASSPASSSGSSRTSTQSEGSHIRPLPIAVIGVGAIGLIASLVLFIVRSNALSSFEQQQCDPNNQLHCANTDAARSQFSSVETLNLLSGVALGIGVVAVVAGGAWLLFGGGHPQSERHTRLDIRPVPGGAFVTIGGSL